MSRTTAPEMRRRGMLFCIAARVKMVLSLSFFFKKKKGLQQQAERITVIELHTNSIQRLREIVKVAL